MIYDDPFRKVPEAPLETGEPTKVTSSVSNRAKNIRRGVSFLLVSFLISSLAHHLFQLKKWSMMEYKPYDPNNCTYDLHEVERFEKMIHDGLETGILNKKCDGGSKEPCFVRYGNLNVAMFKPEKDERARLSTVVSKEFTFENPESMLYRRVHTESGSRKQELITKFDYGNFSCLPKGIETYMTTSNGEERVYLQPYVPNSGTLVEYGRSRLDEVPILNEVPLNEFQKMLILDLIFGNIDRGKRNVLVRQDTQPHLIPIDWDLTLLAIYITPDSFNIYERSKAPLTPDNLAHLRSLDPNQVANRIREEGFPREAALSAKLRLLVLQHFASIAEAHSFIKVNYDQPSGKIQCRFLKLWIESLAEAESKLPRKDLSDYRKGRRIGENIHQERVVPADEQAWYQAYDKQSRDQILDFLEKEATDSFIRRLQKIKPQEAAAWLPFLQRDDKMSSSELLKKV